MRAPTRRQLEVLRAFAELSANGLPPTVRELEKRLGLTGLNGTRQHLTLLEAKGLLTQDPGLSRGRRLTPRGRALLSRKRLVEPLPELCCKCCGASRFGPGSCPICGADSAHMEVA